jgi:UDP-N-acetylglucosamine acyltransferase
MTRIHPSAVVDPRAEIASDVQIGAHCVIDGPVRLGAGCVLHPQVTIMGGTVIGSDNWFFPGSVIGAPPQDLKFDGEQTQLTIGDGNRFREHVTIHPGTATGGGSTVIGSSNLFMVGSHVAHDCHLGSRIVLSNHVLLAGHIRVHDGAIFNGASACHHFTTVGRLAYIGGLTRITQDVHPFTIVEGHPARIRAANVIGMRRAGMAEEDVAIVRSAIFSIFVSEKKRASEAMAEVQATHPDNLLVQELLASVQASQAGRQGRAAEPHRTPTPESAPSRTPEAASGESTAGGRA